MCLGISPYYEISDTKDHLKTNAAWLITAQWIYSLLENKTPFQWPTKIRSVAGFTQTTTCSLDRLEEIAAAGFTLSQNPVEGYSIPPVVILDIGNNSPYHSAGFNLLVNRTARLSAEWFSENKNDDNEDMRANKLHKFLISQLKPYHILSDESSITVGIKNGVATIEFKSEKTIDNGSVHFQFTLET